MRKVVVAAFTLSLLVLLAFFCNLQTRRREGISRQSESGTEVQSGAGAPSSVAVLVGQEGKEKQTSEPPHVVDGECDQWAQLELDEWVPSTDPKNISQLALEIFSLADTMSAAELIDGVVAASAAGGRDLWLFGWALVYKMIQEQGTVSSVIECLLRPGLDEKAATNFFCLLGFVYNDSPEALQFLLAQATSSHPIVPREHILRCFGEIRKKDRESSFRNRLVRVADMKEEADLRDFSEFRPQWVFEVIPPQEVLELLWNIPASVQDMTELDIGGAYEGIFECLNWYKEMGRTYAQDKQIRHQTVEAAIRVYSVSKSPDVRRMTARALTMAQTAEADAFALRTLAGDDSDLVRAEVAFWLNQRENNSIEVQAALLRACTDSSSAVRANAAYRLGVDDSLKPAATATLERLFRYDNCDRVRESALSGLVHLLGREAMPYIEEARMSEHKYLQQHAEACAKAIEYREQEAANRRKVEEGIRKELEELIEDLRGR